MAGARATLAGSLLIAATAAARPAHAQDSVADGAEKVTVQAPAADLPPPSARRDMIFSGLLVAGGFYGVSFVSSYAWSDWRAASAMRIPVVGPFFGIAQTTCSFDDFSGDARVRVMEPECGTGDEIVRAVLAGVSALGQLGGLALIAEGLIMPTAEPVRSARARFIAAPVVSPERVGLSFSGTF